MANFTGLAAARHAVLRAHGWDVEAQGLFGAPPITVVVGNEVHVSLLKGAGHARSRPRARGARAGRRAGPDDRRPSCRRSTGPTIVCAQAGNVNTGAFDPIGEIAARLRGTGAWVHVDGAFGLWAAASPAKQRTGRRRRSRGFARDRRAQMAQRAVRQRPRVRARPARAECGDVRQRRLSDRGSNRATRTCSCQKCRGARAGWRSGRRCARWAGTASRS